MSLTKSLATFRVKSCTPTVTGNRLQGASLFLRTDCAFSLAFNPFALYSYSVSLLMFCFCTVNEISGESNVELLGGRGKEREREHRIFPLCLKCIVRNWCRRSQKLLSWFARERERENTEFFPFFFSKKFPRAWISVHVSHITNNDVQKTTCFIRLFLSRAGVTCSYRVSR